MRSILTKKVEQQLEKRTEEQEDSVMDVKRHHEREKAMTSAGRREQEPTVEGVRFLFIYLFIYVLLSFFSSIFDSTTRNWNEK